MAGSGRSWPLKVCANGREWPVMAGKTLLKVNLFLENAKQKIDSSGCVLMAVAGHGRSWPAS